jgi:hypothetical protein
VWPEREEEVESQGESSPSFRLLLSVVFLAFLAVFIILAAITQGFR